MRKYEILNYQNVTDTQSEQMLLELNGREVQSSEA